MHKIHPVATVGSVLSLLLLSSQAAAITVNLEAAKDNTLYESVNGTLSNGIGTAFFAGKNNNGSTRRGLIQFDIAGGLPEGASITSATLELSVSQVANTLADSIELRRVSAEWGEAGSMAVGGGGGGGGGGPAQTGDATWTHSQTPSVAWTNIGGDFSDTVSASQNVGDVGSYSWSSPQLTLDLQDMLDTPQENFGWLLLGNETFFSTAKRFDSRESSSPPMLTIEYELSHCDADFDGDGDVDADDLDDWKTALGNGNGGDADGDNDTDGADFLKWQRQFTGPEGLQTARVPEPASPVLALVGVILVAACRRGAASKGAKGRK